jgi:hypothetical protein
MAIQLRLAKKDNYLVGKIESSVLPTHFLLNRISNQKSFNQYNPSPGK